MPPAQKLRARTTTNMTTDSQVFGSSWSATAVLTVSGVPLGHAFLQGNEAGIVPVPQATITPPIPPTTATATPAIICPPETVSRPQQLPKRRYVSIGEAFKSWGRLVPLPDPERGQPEQKTTARAEGRTTAGAARMGRCDKWTRLYVRIVELLVARRRSASLSDANAGHDCDEDLYIDADGNTDDRI